MAYENQYLNYDGLSYLWTRVKEADSAWLASAYTDVTTKIAGIATSYTGTADHGIALSYSQTKGILTNTLSITPGEVKTNNTGFITGDAAYNALSTLEGVMHFVELEEIDMGSGDLAIRKVGGDPVMGDFGIISGKEYVFGGNSWVLIGDEVNHLRKDDSVSLDYGLSPANGVGNYINFNGDQTVQLHPSIQTKLALANSALQASDIVTGSANGAISVKGTDVFVKGLNSAAYVTTASLNTTAQSYATAAQTTAYAYNVTEQSRILGASTDAWDKDAPTVNSVFAYVDHFINASKKNGSQINVGGTTGDYKAKTIAYAINDESGRTTTLEGAQGLDTVGTVTTVGISLPNVLFDPSASTMTDTSTTGAQSATVSLAANFQNIAANKVFAAPTSAGGAPTFRALDAADFADNLIPVSTISNFTSAVQGTAVGGTIGSAKSIQAALSDIANSLDDIKINETSIEKNSVKFEIKPFSNDDINDIISTVA